MFGQPSDSTMVLIAELGATIINDMSSGEIDWSVFWRELEIVADSLADEAYDCGDNEEQKMWDAVRGTVHTCVTWLRSDGDDDGVGTCVATLPGVIENQSHRFFVNGLFE